MTYPEHAAALAQELATLARTRASRDLDAPGLAVALTARRDLLHLQRRVLLTITGQLGRLPRVPGPARHATLSVATHSVQALERDPVATLIRVLATVPTPAPVPPSDLAGPPPASPAGRAWDRIRRLSLLAEHEWTERAPVPRGDERWSAAADAAAITRAISVLDHDLLTAAHAHPPMHPPVRDALAASTTCGLRVTATEVLARARAGPLPPWGAPGPERNPRPLLAVHQPADLVAGHRRLTAQITRATDLSPHTTVRLLRGQAILLATAATALARTDPDLARHATGLAHLLDRATTGTHPLATLAPDDPRPHLQTRALLLGVATAGARGWNNPRAQAYLPALAEVIHHAPHVVHALERHANASVRAGRWLVPNTNASAPDDLLWRRSRVHEWKRAPTAAREIDTPPRLLRQLSDVAEQLQHPPHARPPRTATATPDIPPRQTLADITHPIPWPRTSRPISRTRPGSATSATDTPRIGTPRTDRGQALPVTERATASPGARQERQRPPIPAPPPAGPRR
ncbi:MAG: hypothetical protein ACFCUP_11650 [Actinomycetales bacterium]